MILVMCANVISIRLHAPAKVLRCLKISPLLILMWPSGRQVERNWLRNQGMSHGDYHDILISKVAKNIAKHIHFDGRIPTCFNRKSNEVHMGHIGKKQTPKANFPCKTSCKNQELRAQGGKSRITSGSRSNNRYAVARTVRFIQYLYTVCCWHACQIERLWGSSYFNSKHLQYHPELNLSTHQKNTTRHRPTLFFFLTVFISFGTPVAGEASGSIALWVLLKSNNCRLVWATGTGKTLLVGWVHVVI